MSREYRQVRPGFLEVRAAQDGTSGRIVADVMKYNVIDDYRTAFEPRCFSESLETRMPRILWSHNAHDPIGQWIDAEDTPDRLRLAGALDLAMIDGTMTPAVPSAHRAFAQLRSRTIDQFSVGFVRQGEARNKLRQGVTSITKAQLDEASPILLGSVPGAELVSVRSANPDMLFGRQRRLTFFPREIRSAALDAEREERVAGGQFARGGGRVPGSAKAGSGPVVPSLPGFPKRGHMDTKRLEAAAARVEAKNASASGAGKVRLTAAVSKRPNWTFSATRSGVAVHKGSFGETGSVSVSGASFVSRVRGKTKVHQSADEAVAWTERAVAANEAG